MSSETFLAQVREQLKLIFLGTANGRPPTVREKGRLEGFMRAGVVLGVTTNPELRTLMEEVHFEVFGQSIEGRKASRKPRFSDEGIDYGPYETPSIERMGPSRD